VEIISSFRPFKKTLDNVDFDLSPGKWLSFTGNQIYYLFSQHPF